MYLARARRLAARYVTRRGLRAAGGSLKAAGSVLARGGGGGRGLGPGTAGCDEPRLSALTGRPSHRAGSRAPALGGRSGEDTGPQSRPASPVALPALASPVEPFSVT